MKRKINTLFNAVLVLLFSVTTMASAQMKLNPGVVSFQQNGKSYTAKVTNGHAMIGMDKKAIFGLNCSVEQDNRLLSVSIDIKKMGEFKPGKIRLGKMDDQELGNFAVFINTGDGNADPNDPDTGAASPKDVSADAETGSFTLTAVQIQGSTAVISGSFEFSGKNSIEEGAEKNISVKGSFANVQVRCLSPNLLKKQ